MSDEYTVHGRFLMGKIDEAEYLRKMAYMRAQEEAETSPTEGGTMKKLETVAAWSADDLNACIGDREVVEGPYQRDLQDAFRPNGPPRVQFYAYVRAIEEGALVDK